MNKNSAFFRKFPRVSVIMPHFGCEDYLRGAVESILSQEFEDWELFIVDDASKSFQWLELIGDLIKDSRIVLYRTNRNVGPYRIKNRVISKVSSPYIAFQDADDISHPQRLGYQIQYLEKKCIDILGCSFNYISKEGEQISTCRMVKNVNMWMKLGKTFASLHPTTMVKRGIFDLLGGFDGTTKFAADSDFFLRAAHVFRLRNLRKSLYSYRLRKESLSGSYETGHGSKAREAYASDMWKREKQRCAINDKRELVTLLKAPMNDIDFYLERIEA